MDYLSLLMNFHKLSGINQIQFPDMNPIYPHYEAAWLVLSFILFQPLPDIWIQIRDCKSTIKDTSLKSLEAPPAVPLTTSLQLFAGLFPPLLHQSFNWLQIFSQLSKQKTIYYLLTRTILCYKHTQSLTHTYPHNLFHTKHTHIHIYIHSCS